VRRGTRAMLALGVLIPSMIGAAVIGVMTSRALPTGAALADHNVLRLNIITAAIYTGIAGPIGMMWGLLWTTVPRGGDEAGATHHAVVAIPTRLTVINATVWTMGALVLAAVNAKTPWLAVTLGISTLLGALVTATLTYWLCTRVLRSFVAEVLTENPPTSPRGPSLRLRAVTSWGVGTGVPLLMVLLVAASALVVDYSADRLAVAVLAMGSCVVISGLAVAAFTGATTADPIDEVRRGMARVGRGDYDVTVPVFDASELGLLQAGFNAMASGLRERERIRDLFGRHVGRDVARHAEQSAPDTGAAMGGEKCDAAVLFVDLVGSTRLATVYPPEEFVAMLNEFFAVVVEVVEQNGGLVNKFEGDAVLAVFGAPVPIADNAGRALAAARELYRRLASTTGDIKAGIGVSAGIVVAGNIGDPRRYEYTVIGDPVNEAARLTEIAKRTGGVAASGAALSRASHEEARLWRITESRTLRGRDRKTDIAVPAA
jgi:adenylate cyclase